MKKIVLLLSILILVSSCGNYEHQYSKQYRATDIISMPEMLKDEYGYLFLAHKKRTQGSHLVLDNCRKAGIYYTDTFTIVKLLPGNHRIRIVRPTSAYQNHSIVGRAATASFNLNNIKGGEVFVYDDVKGWTEAMKMVKKDINYLKDFKVSVDCYDCSETPTPEKVFDLSCMR